MHPAFIMSDAAKQAAHAANAARRQTSPIYLQAVNHRKEGRPLSTIPYDWDSEEGWDYRAGWFEEDKRQRAIAHKLRET